MSDRVELSIDGRVFHDWSRVSVSLSIDSLSDSFDLVYTDRDALRGKALSIVEGDAFKLKLNGEQVMDGFVDTVQVRYDAERHDFQVSGRSRTADLVDCTAINDVKSWDEVGLAKIAEDLCEPFSIAVTDLVGDLKPFRRFSLEFGETVYDALLRGAKERGVLLGTDQNGDLEITRAGSESIRTAIVLGKNVLASSRRADARDRFSEYTVVSQSAGDNGFNGESARGGFAQATDPQVERYRPMAFVSEGSAASGDLDRRAEWERNTRGGKSRRISYTLQGWSHEDGVWRSNRLVDVEDPFLRVSDQLLISSVSMTLSDQGARTDLDLVHPAAYNPLQPPKTRSNRKTCTVGLTERIRAERNRALEKLERRIMNRVRLLLTRGQITEVDDAADVQTVTVGLLKDEARKRVERFQRYGFTSVPPSGTECVAVSVGGNRDHLIVIAEDARGVRITSLQPGEGGIYSDGSASVICKANGDIEIVPGAGNVLIGSTAATDFVAKADTLISVFDTALAAAISAAVPVVPPDGGDGGTIALTALQTSWNAAKNSFKATKAKVF